jgi:sec-independent protein translocase protein TatB
MSVIVTPAIQLASLGIPDTLFLMLLALVVFGPRRLPEIGRQIGKLMYEFRKVSNDFRFQMEEELRASEEADRQKKLQASLPPPVQPALSDASMIHEPVRTPVPELAASAYETPPAHDPEALPAGSLATDAPLESGTEHPVSVESSSVESSIDQTIGSAKVPLSQSIHVQPPLTGETVAAARPFRAVSAHAPDTEATSDPSPSPSQEPEAHHA